MLFKETVAVYCENTKKSTERKHMAYLSLKAEVALHRKGKIFEQ
jgi:hypothetical protein